MDNMPVDYYNYYTLLEPYISAYYEVGAKDKARELFKQVSKKYQENLTYYADQDEITQYQKADDILTDIQRYKAILDVVNQYDKGDFADKESESFSNYLDLFDFGKSKKEPIEEAPPIDEDILPTTDSVIVPVQNE
ncbi:MAG TPA: hypothetical protein P5264_04010, partial [Mangrovimonas sp.]|nr:hypothetical protein [Mangrovimonas sp.]